MRLMKASYEVNEVEITIVMKAPSRVELRIGEHVSDRCIESDEQCHDAANEILVLAFGTRPTTVYADVPDSEIAGLAKILRDL